MTKAVLVVLTECADPSKEKEFNDWYTNIHTEDVLKTPGFVSVRRFEKVDSPRKPGRPESPAKYLAVWELDTESVHDTMAALTQQTMRPVPDYVRVVMFDTFQLIATRP